MDGINSLQNTTIYIMGYKLFKTIIRFNLGIIPKEYLIGIVKILYKMFTQTMMYSSITQHSFLMYKNLP